MATVTNNTSVSRNRLASDASPPPQTVGATPSQLGRYLEVVAPVYECHGVGECSNLRFSFQISTFLKALSDRLGGYKEGVSSVAFTGGTAQYIYFDSPEGTECLADTDVTFCMREHQDMHALKMRILRFLEQEGITGLRRNEEDPFYLRYENLRTGYIAVDFPRRGEAEDFLFLREGVKDIASGDNFLMLTLRCTIRGKERDLDITFLCPDENGVMPKKCRFSSDALRLEAGAIFEQPLEFFFVDGYGFEESIELSKKGYFTVRPIDPDERNLTLEDRVYEAAKRIRNGLHGYVHELTKGDLIPDRPEIEQG